MTITVRLIIFFTRIMAWFVWILRTTAGGFVWISEILGLLFAGPGGR